MSKTSAFYAADPEVGRRVLDDIEDMFRLTQDNLMDITSHFLKDFELGLSEYNHPMAMMCVPPQIQHPPLSYPLFAVPPSSPAYQTAQRSGECLFRLHGRGIPYLRASCLSQTAARSPLPAALACRIMTVGLSTLPCSLRLGPIPGAPNPEGRP